MDSTKKQPTELQGPSDDHSSGSGSFPKLPAPPPGLALPFQLSDAEIPLASEVEVLAEPGSPQEDLPLGTEEQPGGKPAPVKEKIWRSTLPTPPPGLFLPGRDEPSFLPEGDETPHVPSSSLDSVSARRAAIRSARLGEFVDNGTYPPPARARQDPDEFDTDSVNTPTPTIEPFPGLRKDSVPKLDEAELMRANLSLTGMEMFLLSRIDGRATTGELEEMCTETTPAQLLDLMMKLWRAGILTF